MCFCMPHILRTAFESAAHVLILHGHRNDWGRFKSRLRMLWGKVVLHLAAYNYTISGFDRAVEALEEAFKARNVEEVIMLGCWTHCRHLEPSSAQPNNTVLWGLISITTSTTYPLLCSYCMLCSLLAFNILC